MWLVLAADLPSYVAIAERRDRSHGPGFLGTQHQPLYVLSPAKGVENLASPGAPEQMQNRLDLLSRLESGFARDYQSSVSQDRSMPALCR